MAKPKRETFRENVPLEPPARPDGWPDDMEEAAFHGPAGEFALLIEPHTEADQHGILLDTLVTAGNVMGRGAYFPVEAVRHHLNEFTLQIGDSAKARKGTALGYTDLLRQEIDPSWAKDGVKSGMSTGEGLIRALEHMQINGCTDKRLLAIEDEFGSTLIRMQRQGNTLTTTTRRAWDGKSLQVMTKGQPQLVEGAHVSMIAHTTHSDLRRHLSSVDITNGFMNRFLLACIHRRRFLPFGGSVPESDLTTVIRNLKHAVEFGKQVGEIGIDKKARQKWIDIYPILTADIPGDVGAVVSRAEAHVRRLAAIYAVLDQDNVVAPQHLDAALAVWDYCLNSAKFVFGNGADLGEKGLEKKLLHILQDAARAMSRTEISAALNNHYKGEHLSAALQEIERRGEAGMILEPSGGRRKEVWFLIKKENTNANVNSDE